MRGEHMGGPGASDRAFFEAKQKRDAEKKERELRETQIIASATTEHANRFKEASKLAKFIMERVEENGEPQAAEIQTRVTDIVDRFTEESSTLHGSLERGELNGYGEDTLSDPLGTELYTTLSKELVEKYTAELTALANEVLAGDYNWTDEKTRKVELSLI